ncbi:kinase-like domain-containing protein [Ochromonadaceae sp. CCMP2298]|nr:kinase-like domain-containing protein [Ochromonadaceae sp. CCMP2298]|mmetsp:Transcript_31279/g.68972  ORF Transcript_31279/g.68972 Transcript_31279/m.68972 type:complete len:772 (-) Transcript_31279:251-2566(-)
MEELLSREDLPATVKTSRKGILRNTYEKLGSGSFGVVYKYVVHPSKEEDFYAVKIEKKGGKHLPQLRHEYKVYKELEGLPSFAEVWGWYEFPLVNVLVMEMLGLSIEDLFKQCRRRFSIKTVLKLADQFIANIEELHSRFLVHRDIKPSNFVIGGGGRVNDVILVDFGLTTRYRDKRTLQHKPFSEYRSLIGTARYASINNHLGIQYSRRDDMESLAYCLIYFLCGSLPWQGLYQGDKDKIKFKSRYDKYSKVLDKKKETTVEVLCDGLPAEFAKFLVYSKSIKYEADPDYAGQRRMFKSLFDRMECENSYPNWDWEAKSCTPSPAQPSPVPPKAPVHVVGDGALNEARPQTRSVAQLRAQQETQRQLQETADPLAAQLQQEAFEAALREQEEVEERQRETQAQQEREEARLVREALEAEAAEAQREADGGSSKSSSTGASAGEGNGDNEAKAAVEVRRPEGRSVMFVEKENKDDSSRNGRGKVARTEEDDRGASKGTRMDVDVPPLPPSQDQSSRPMFPAMTSSEKITHTPVFMVQAARMRDVEFLSIGTREAERAHTGIGMFDVLVGKSLQEISTSQRFCSDKVSQVLQHSCLIDANSHFHLSRFVVIYDTTIDTPVACACAFPYPKFSLERSQPGIDMALKEVLGFSAEDCAKAWQRCAFMDSACAPTLARAEGEYSYWRVDEVYVSPNYRGFGLGAKVVAAAMAECNKYVERGMKGSPYLLGCAVGNTPAKRVYESLGFRVADTAAHSAACQAALNCPGFHTMVAER